MHHRSHAMRGLVSLEAPHIRSVGIPHSSHLDPFRLPALGLSLVMVAALSPPASRDPGKSGDAPYRGKVISLMNHMRLEQKVGQLFVIGVAGRDANTVSDTAKATNQRLFGVDTPAQAIAKYQPGGVIYYTTRNNDDNIGDPAQVATLSNGLQTAALAQPAKIPLQISVDQEGCALVARFGAPATQMPGNMALGVGRSVADAHRSAEVIGTELAAVGVTQDYAPVSDININPNNPVIEIRSIGGNPTLVSHLASAQVRGSAPAGSPRSRAISGPRLHLRGQPLPSARSDQQPRPGPPDRPANLHSGHRRWHRDDQDRPGRDARDRSLNPGHDVAEDLHRAAARRAQLQRTDVDALDMAGAAATYPADVAPVQALLAGADQLLIPVEMDTAVAAVPKAVRTGVISQQRIDESVYRVLLHKYKRGMLQDPIVDTAAAPQIMGAPQHLADAQAITDLTTALVENEGGVLPLAAGPHKVIVAGWGVGKTQTMATAIAACGATTQVRESGTTPSATAITSAVTAAASAGLVVISTNNAYAVNVATGLPSPSAAAQTKLVNALLATGKPVVVAEMRNPCDVASFPEAATVVETFGYTTHQVELLVRVMFGEVKPVGKLPVSIPKADGSGELFPFGHGLGH